MTAAPATAPARRPARRQVVVASAAVLLGAADTYVVVVVLPAIMAAVGIDVEHLQQAAPIVSGFLLGYIGVLPLAGRLSDLHGRRPVLFACLLGFAAGSLVTASATSLPVLVAGRAAQGAGAGGLVPVTLALVADRWPPHRRGVPLGAVGAVQELGSIVGPLYGAALATASTWRAIFYVNLPIAAGLGAGLRDGAGERRARAPLDAAGVVLAAGCAAATVLAVAAPSALTDSATLGAVYVPVAAGAAILSPIAIVAIGAGIAAVARALSCPPSRRAVPPLRRLPALARDVDWPGAGLGAAALACVVVAFATADPQHAVLSDSAPALLAVAAVLVALFVGHELRTDVPLVDVRALRGPVVAGSLLASLAVGVALIAALVDVPVFARTTVDPDSQVAAALVLGRLLVAIPVGALAGGALVGALGHRVVGAAGLLLAAATLLVMSRWTAASLTDPVGAAGWLHPADLALVGCGIGLGLSVVPVAAAMLGAVPARLHGVAASLTVAARMIGMLTGISLLTALGLRRFYSVEAVLPNPTALCPRSPLHCAPFDHLATAAAVDELHVIFLGAAVAALAGAVVCAMLLGSGRSASPVHA